MDKISLRAARVNAKLTLKEVSECIGVSANTISSWETGKSYPRTKNVIKLCELYKVDFKYLDFGDDD